MGLQEQVENQISKRRLLAPGQGVLVAVSGGVDSVVLLHILAELSHKFSWKLAVAHLNHQLRGASSLADERLVRRTSRALNLPVVIERANVRAFAKQRHLSIEMAARTMRHEFLARTAIQQKIRAVALAHHSDDQVELFFLRLFRGSGAQGLTGMNWSGRSPSDQSVTLIRPLLAISKKELHDFALRRGLVFRLDATNEQLVYQRNRIRHELLPLLERHYQPQLRANLVRVIEILRGESEFIESVAQSWLSAKRAGRKAIRASNGKHTPVEGTLIPAWATSEFAALPVAIQRRCIQLQLIQQKIPPEFDLIEHLRCQPGVPIEVSPSQFGSATQWRLARDAGGKVERAIVEKITFELGERKVEVGSGGELAWEGAKLAWQVRSAKGSKLPQRRSGHELFDADAVGPWIVVRHWRPGDRFQPIGNSHASKLQDLFVNQKVPRAKRRRLMVAATGSGELFWVEGMRISERFKLSANTIRRLHWALRRR